MASRTTTVISALARTAPRSCLRAATARSCLATVVARPLRQPMVPLLSTPVGRPVVTRLYSEAASPIKTWQFEDIQELGKNPRKDIVLVDVREPGELQQTGRIPGAINIPINSLPDSFHVTEEEFEDRLGHPRPSKDKELLVYCKAGVRAHAAAALAQDAGWATVGEYPGSWLDWAAKGGETQK